MGRNIKTRSTRYGLTSLDKYLRRNETVDNAISNLVKKKGVGFYNTNRG